MRVFSKIVFICNICFIISVWMWLLEHGRVVAGNTNHIIKLPFIESSLVLLGFGAVYINFIFVLIYLIRIAIKKPVLPNWMSITNVVLFVAQLFFFFVYK